MSSLPQLRSVYLKPGEIAVLDEPSVVSTVLGSCISFTFFHRKRRLAGITHALLPHGSGQEGYRFVDGSTRHLLESFLRKGIAPGELEIKLFGGADMFEGGKESRAGTVGGQNIRAALGFIEKEGLRLAASDVGGQQGRKILFHTHTGEVFLKRLPRQQIPTDCR